MRTTRPVPEARENQVVEILDERRSSGTLHGGRRKESEIIRRLEGVGGGVKDWTGGVLRCVPATLESRCSRFSISALSFTNLVGLPSIAPCCNSLSVFVLNRKFNFLCPHTISELNRVLFVFRIRLHKGSAARRAIDREGQRRPYTGPVAVELVLFYTRVPKESPNPRGGSLNGFLQPSDWLRVAHGVWAEYQSIRRNDTVTPFRDFEVLVDESR